MNKIIKAYKEVIKRLIIRIKMDIKNRDRGQALKYRNVNRKSKMRKNLL
jgi:hypothetical protein